MFVSLPSGDSADFTTEPVSDADLAYLLQLLFSPEPAKAVGA